MLSVQQIFDLGVRMGIAADPRGVKGVQEAFKQQKKKFEDMAEKDKPFFNHERLTNPYPDSAVLVDDKKTRVRRVMAGIDIDAGEILLASQLTERGKKIDLVIGHHPFGRALAELHDVMEMTIDIQAGMGIPIHLAEKTTEERIKEIGRRVHPVNHNQVVRIAELLGINVIGMHTITDNLVQQFIARFIAKNNPKTVGDLMDLLMEIPEYKEARMISNGPQIIVGAPHHRVGKWAVEMTGGTEPSNKIYDFLSRSGVSTVVGMHFRDMIVEKSTDHNMNVVVAGHMASDSLGMNLFLDELEKKGIEIVPCSGLIRVSRAKKANRQRAK